MTLDEYVAEQKRALDQFAAWWNDQATSNPEDFPTELQAGEWDEQWYMFDLSSDHGAEDAYGQDPQPNPES